MLFFFSVGQAQDSLGNETKSCFTKWAFQNRYYNPLIFERDVWAQAKGMKARLVFICKIFADTSRKYSRRVL